MNDWVLVVIAGQSVLCLLVLGWIHKRTVDAMMKAHRDALSSERIAPPRAALPVGGIGEAELDALEKEQELEREWTARTLSEFNGLGDV